MKCLSLFGAVMMLAAIPASAFATNKLSLDILTAKQCRKFAISYAFKKLHKEWVETRSVPPKVEVSLRHVDRSMPYGTEIDLEHPEAGEIAGYSNVSAVYLVDPICSLQYEMIVKGTPNKDGNTVKCEIIKERQRCLLHDTDSDE